MQKVMSVFLVPFLAIFLVPANVSADGGFVVPKFVWDKHKDINEPTQKAIIVYDAGREDLILQVKYEGPVDQFGWLIPVPSRPDVQKGSMKCFYELSQYTQRRFGDGGPIATRSASLGEDSAVKSAPPPVKVIETKTVGVYDIAVLSTRDAGALKTWLDDNQFYIPPDRSGVLDDYVKQRWYFVAVKINLGDRLSTSPSTSSQLASGELHPLRISFATEHCVFPLKISSINGKQSEVQLYVLSLQPLLEKGMLEQKQLLIYSNDVGRAIDRVRWRKETIGRHIEIARQAAIERFGSDPPDWEGEEAVHKWHDRPCPAQHEVLPYAKVLKLDLPECHRLIPALGEKSWWLTKQTWIFQPREMRDLTFEPAWPVFMRMLSSPYGYFAGPSLASFGEDGVPLLLEAMQSSSPVVRINAASTFYVPDNWANIYTIIDDSRITNAALKWIKDTEQSVRLAGLCVLTRPSQPDAKFTGALVPLLQDPDRGIRYAAVSEVGMDRNDPASGEVLMVLLHNSEAFARLSGVTVLFRNANKQSVELALPLLKDPNRYVKELAGSTLRALTGQDFATDQADEWQAWWDQNKADFHVQLRRQEFGIHLFKNQ